MAQITITDLTKRFGNMTALENIDLEVEKGQIVGLLGPNGSGKTTLIKIMTGLLQPTSGNITINGKEPGIETKKIVAYLPDRNALPDHMTTKQLINLYEDFFEDFDRENAERMATDLGLDFDQEMKKMSKGTKEKVQLILTMSREVNLYILDEPIGGVDPAARDYILNTIINNYKEDATVIISTHLINDVESVLNHILFLKQGVVVRQGDVDDIREETGMSIDALFREEFKC